jgi:type I restriction enzyme, S subunit
MILRVEKKVTPIGPIPKDWQKTTLKDVSEFITKGATPTTYGFDWVEDGIPFLRSECVSETGFNEKGLAHISEAANDALQRSKVKANDLLISITGNVGRVAVFPEYLKEGNINQHIARVRILPQKVCDRKYIYFQLTRNAYRKYYDGIITGAAYPQLSLKQIRDTPIYYPPLPTQRKIAAILSTYDDLIENNLKRIKLLEEKAQLTYEEWFVRMKFPGHETTPINEETGLPEGLEEKPLGDLIDITSSKRIFLSDYVKEGIPFYRGKEIILKSKNETLNDRLYITQERFDEIKSKFGIPQKGDLLITAVGTLGYPYLVTDSDGDFYFKDGNLIWFKGNKAISSLYLISCFKDPQFRSNLDNIAIGSSQKALTIKSLKGLKILNPTKNLSTQYDKIIEPILDSSENLQNQNQLLKEARDILLPRLMTGMIDVETLDLSGFEAGHEEEMLMTAEGEI